MNTILRIGAAAFVAAGILAYGWPRQARSGGSARPQGMRLTQDLGDVVSGVPATAAFKLTNPYSVPLELGQTHASCACAHISFTPARLEPGEAAAVEMQIRTRDAVGVMRVDGTIDAKLTGEGHVAIELEAVLHLKGLLTLSEASQYIDLGRCALSALPLRGNVKVKRGGHPLKWDRLAVRTDSSELAVDIAPGAVDEWDVSIVYLNPRALGGVSSLLEFCFFNGIEELPYRVSRRVVARIEGPIGVTPGTLMWAGVAPRQPVTRTIRLSARDESRAGLEKRGMVTGEIVILARLDQEYKIVVPYLLSTQATE